MKEGDFFLTSGYLKFFSVNQLWLVKSGSDSMCEGLVIFLSTQWGRSGSVPYACSIMVTCPKENHRDGTV